MVLFVVVVLFIGSLGRSFSSVVCSLVLEAGDTVGRRFFHVVHVAERRL